MNWGFGGITSGLGGGASTSDFLRFLGLAFALIEFELGSCECESYSGGILGCRGETWTGGGEHEGREEGGEKEIGGGETAYKRGKGIVVRWELKQQRRRSRISRGRVRYSSYWKRKWICSRSLAAHGAERCISDSHAGVSPLRSIRSRATVFALCFPPPSTSRGI